MQVKRQQLEPDMKQWTGSKLGKEYKVVYCHPAYLTYMQSILCKMRDWMTHKLESRLLGEILIFLTDIRYADDTTLMAESEEELKSLLIKVKEESEKAGLKCSIQKPKITASSPIQLSSVSQSHPTLRPHEPQHTRPPCPSPTPGVNANSRPSSR